MALIALMALVSAVSTVGADEPEIDTFSVRDQPVNQVLLAFAERTGVSIVPDATVTGEVSLVLHDSSPERAIRRIAEAADLFVEDRHGIWHVSRVRVRRTSDGLWQGESRGALLPALVGRIARSAGISVRVAAETHQPVEISVAGDSPRHLLTRLATAVNLNLREEEGVFHLEHAAEQNRSAQPRPRGTVVIENTATDGTVLTAVGAPREAVLREMADFLNCSLVITGDLTASVSAVEITAPSAEQLPRSVATALNLRLYRETDTLYAADEFDSDGLRPFFRTRFLSIAGRYREALTGALATVPDLSISGETDRGMLISGMERSLNTAEELAEVLVASRSEMRVFQYTPRAGDAAAIVEALTVEFEQAELRVVSGREAILGWVPPQTMAAIEAAARRWDTAESRRRYRCRFADPREILEFVSDHFAGSQAAITADGTAITLVGPPATHAAVQQYLRDVDRPRQQLRFDLCIIQYQSGQAVQHGVDFFAEHTPGVAVHAAPLTGSGGFNGVLELQFDVISRLGYQAAVAISDELTENRARLVLDTSLKALHRETARLENSSTFRYRDVLGEDDESSWRSVVREITSGLSVEVTGSLHDDRSITVDIRVELSRQGADVSRNGNPPPTSQRVVESTVRVHPGEPVIIGGLLQQEQRHSEHRFPLLGRIPVLRRIINRHDHHAEENELVLYLSAFPESPPSTVIHEQRQIERLHALTEGGLR
ncbi:MAG TPA: hypothetical protein VJ932_04655 [Alkalispirochaeta sp.]|nr:hypothetical protein [Alkalispirochaeta sp.]